MSTKEDKVDLDKLIIDHREIAHRTAKKLMRQWGAYLDYGEIESLADLALCQAAKGFKAERGTSFRTYLHLYLKGNLIKSMKSQKNYPSLLIDDSLTLNNEKTPESDLILKESLGLCHQILYKLPPIEREIAKKVIFYDLQEVSIARSLGCTRSYISKLKSHAISFIKERFYTIESDIDNNSRLSVDQGWSHH